MPRDLTPAEIGRMHALADLAEAAQARADARPPQPELAAEDADYLRAYAETCRSVAQRLRTSPGAAP